MMNVVSISTLIEITLEEWKGMQTNYTCSLLRFYSKIEMALDVVCC